MAARCTARRSALIQLKTSALELAIHYHSYQNLARQVSTVISSRSAKTNA